MWGTFLRPKRRSDSVRVFSALEIKNASGGVDAHSPGFCEHVICFTAGAGLEPAKKQADINKSLVRRAFQAMEQGDLKTLNEVFDAKGPIHTPQGKILQRGGPFADLKSSCPMCAALNNRKITIDSLLSDGDLVAVRSTWSGKYS